MDDRQRGGGLHALAGEALLDLLAAGAIPHRKHEGRVLFHRGELDAWLDRYREGRTGPADLPRRPRESDLGAGERPATRPLPAVPAIPVLMRDCRVSPGLMLGADCW